MNENIIHYLKMGCSFINKNGGYIYGYKNSNIKFDFNYNYDKYNDEYNIFIGNNRSCLLVLMPKNNPNKEAIIEKFEYHQECDIHKKLTKGYGTIIMMKTLLRLLKNRLSIKMIYLTDKSTIYCNEIKYKKIPLYYLYLFRYKKPYYVEKFNFKFSHNNEKLNHNENIKKMLKIKINKKEIKNYFLENNSYLKNFDKNKLKEFLSFINNKEYLYKFVKKFNDKNLCYFFFLLLEYYFKKYNMNSMFCSVYYKKL
jgi:hypothetical protein